MNQPQLIAMGLPDLLFIIFLAMILFGGRRLGDIGKGLGQGIRNFKTAVKDDKKPDNDSK